MAELQKRDLVQEAMDLFPSYWDDKPKALGLLRSLLNTLQNPIDLVFEILNGTSLWDAVGNQLDLIGKLWGVSRAGSSDNDYRIRISTVILQNVADSTPEKIMEIIKAASGADSINLYEHYPNGVIVYAETTLKEYLKDVGDRIVGAGKSFNIMFPPLQDDKSGDKQSDIGYATTSTNEVRDVPMIVGVSSTLIEDNVIAPDGTTTADTLFGLGLKQLPVYSAVKEYFAGVFLKKNPSATASTSVSLEFNGGVDDPEYTSIISTQKLRTLLTDETGSITGTELVTNGTFDTDTAWTKGTGWTISGGAANCDGTQTALSALSTTASLTWPPIGESVVLSFDVISRTTGAVALNVGPAGGVEGPFVTTVGTHSLIYVVKGGETVAGVIADADFVGSVDNFTVRRAIPDLSTTNLGLGVYGTLQRNPIATGSEVQAFSGFSASNYLRQPPTSALNFTGNFYISAWCKKPSTPADKEILTVGDTSTPFPASGIHIWTYGGTIKSYVCGVYHALATTTGDYFHLLISRSGSTLYMYIDGVLVKTTSGNSTAVNSGTYGLTVGKGFYPGHTEGVIGVVADSFAPTAQQVKKMYEVESRLFDPYSTLSFGGEEYQFDINLATGSYTQPYLQFTEPCVTEHGDYYYIRGKAQCTDSTDTSAEIKIRNYKDSVALWNPTLLAVDETKYDSRVSDGVFKFSEIIQAEYNIIDHNANLIVDHNLNEILATTGKNYSMTGDDTGFTETCNLRRGRPLCEVI